ncbi:uncharacterized protein LOC120352269 [Nilaparvata lugens]|uniref:uncharacterized protein LOC120352269 n=1 Tax=Nilaparvata lugens TaxID=108931 RepID=UPI00193E346C|nr:uncharacterized protein LOC120352269 [Nilaparvata lugens]
MYRWKRKRRKYSTNLRRSTSVGRMTPLRYHIGDALFVELPRVRLDGGAKAFRQRWGYEGGNAPAAPPLMEEDEGNEEAEEEGETVSLREEVFLPSSPLDTSYEKGCKISLIR